MKKTQFTKFQLSKPYGYYPPAVDQTIDQYERTIGAMNSKLVEQQQLVTRLQDRISKLEDELRRMHIEMSSMELPDADEVVAGLIMQDFKQYNAPVQPPVTSYLPPPNEGMSIVGDSPVNQDVAQLFELEDDDDERVGMPQSTMQQSQQPQERVQLPSLGRFKLNGGEPLRAVQQEQSVPDDDDEDGGFDPFRIVT